MISFEEALEKIIASCTPWDAETVPLSRALGRVLAEDIAADRDYPPFNRATMDGFAVRSEDILEKGSADLRVIGELFAGDNRTFTLQRGDAVKIMTGAPVPDSADAVIKKEDTREQDGVVSVRTTEFKWGQNIAARGEDSGKGEVVLAKHARINFGHLSMLAALGKSAVQVIRLPRVAVISTGNELRPVTGSVEAHQIRDSNGWAVAGFLHHYSIEPVQTSIVRDAMDDLTAAIRSAIDCDLLIISGGVSAGDADLVPGALAACGVKEVFHRVKVKPGKPLWFGLVPDGVRVFALPGNPFSVQTACRMFIDPYVRACCGITAAAPLRLPLQTARKKRTGFDEFFPASLRGDAQTRIDPLLYTTSGDITAMAGSDGIARHAAAAGDLNAGDVVEVYLWPA